jgi:HK97 family phage prohead protease
MRATPERCWPVPTIIPETYEIRDALTAEAGEIELRTVQAADDRPGFDGYVSTWWTVDDRGTAFAPGAFKKTLRERMKIAPILVNHDFYGSLPIGKHLSATEDDKGVRISAALSETTAGQDALRLLRDGVPVGLSFGFDRIADRSATEKDALDLSVAPDYIKSAPTNELRIITEVRFWESSLVTFPANAKAKPDTIRAIGANDLPLLLHAIRSGSLSDDERARIEQIVAAYQERAAAGFDHGTRDNKARPNDRRSDVALALARAAQLRIAA